MTPIDTVRTSSFYAATTTARIVQTFKPGTGWSLVLTHWLEGGDGETPDPARMLTTSELRRLKRRGITHLNLELLDADGDRIARPDYSVAELLDPIDPLERGPEESRDQHISRLLRLWERQRDETPNGKAQRATWAALLSAADDESEVERRSTPGGKMLRPVGTYVAWGDWKGRWVLGRVKRHLRSRRHRGLCEEVYQKYRKAGGWTKGR